jgi:hypothetical protein
VAANAKGGSHIYAMVHAHQKQQQTKPSLAGHDQLGRFVPNF